MYRSLAPALVSMVAACAARDTDASQRPETACDHSCCDFVSRPYTRTYLTSMSAEIAAEVAGDDGVISGAECASACMPWETIEPDVCGVRTWVDLVEFTRVTGCASEVSACGTIVTCDAEFRSTCEGRDHARLRRRPAARAGVAGWLTGAAEAEAGSVLAFRALADELRGHGAPAALVRDLRRAARDEVRHARIVGGLARAAGGRPASRRIARGPRRPMVELAIENAVEGRVGETFAAAIALWQAEHAADVRLRAAMRAIARDEVRHAALAERVAAFCARRLGASDRDRVSSARAEALQRLRWRAPDPAVATPLGLPDEVSGQALVEGLRTLGRP